MLIHWNAILHSVILKFPLHVCKHLLEVGALHLGFIMTLVFNILINRPRHLCFAQKRKQGSYYSTKKTRPEMLDLPQFAPEEFQNKIQTKNVCISNCFMKYRNNQ